MTRKLSITALLFTLSLKSVTAQYYYKDIVSNKQAMAEKTALKERSIRSIKVHSFEGNGEASKGFFCEKKISKDQRKVETYTKSYISGKALLISYFNDLGQLLRSTDSSELNVSSTAYEYTDKGNIKSISSSSHSNDDDFTTVLLEVHQYRYNEKNHLVSMLRIKNHKDSATIHFITDEKGNVTDETDESPHGKHYYYYYDDRNRLTDVVKYNTLKGKLLPDFMFEYNSASQVTQMVSVEDGINSDYYTWKYVYLEGLRIIEKCFSKEKLLLGYFEYEYE